MEQLKQLFAQWAGVPCAECLALGANGSSRRYYRLIGFVDTTKVDTLIRSHNNLSTYQPVNVSTITAIGAIADDVRENEAFFAYSRHFRDRGIRVPELYAVADDRRHYLQQDLGDQTLYGLLHGKKQQGGGFDAEMLGLYRQALADLHNIQVAGRDLDFSVAYPRPAFDRRSILWDLNYFKYYFLKLQHIPFDEEHLENDFQHLADILLAADTNYFLYRDFNPRNIMVAVSGQHPDGGSPLTANRCPLTAKLYYIDYQGGRRGAAQYDVASLLYSAKSDLPQAIRNELLHHYVNLHGDPHFLDHFWHYLLVRILQTLGAYGYRGLYERKPYFIESIPLALANLRTLAEDHHDILAELPELRKVVRSVESGVRSDEFGVVVSPQFLTPNLTVSVQSFSYKQGLPEDTSGNGGGHIFDCRALPNPGRYPEYKAYTGKDAPVIDFLRDKEPVRLFLDHALAIVTQSVDKYLERHFTHLSVAFGCTGGQHRSVYCAEQLAAALRKRYPHINVELKHREQEVKGER